jgi:hypothetical protein
LDLGQQLGSAVKIALPISAPALSQIARGWLNRLGSSAARPVPEAR